jgi:hypothetical protein
VLKEKEGLNLSERFVLVEAWAALEGQRAMEEGAVFAREIGRPEIADLAERAARALTIAPAGEAVEVPGDLLPSSGQALVVRAILAMVRAREERDALRDEVERLRRAPSGR